MTSFDMALEFVFGEEGGFVDDPKDSGGATKFGISQRAYPDENIPALTKERAMELYRLDYWDRCSCGSFPPQLAIILFDAAVNQGPTTAIRMLQKALGVRDDGVVGPETLRIANRVSALGSVIPQFIAERALRYALHQSVHIYGRGWYRRIARCHQYVLETK